MFGVDAFIAYDLVQRLFWYLISAEQTTQTPSTSILAHPKTHPKYTKYVQMKIKYRI